MLFSNQQLTLDEVIIIQKWIYQTSNIIFYSKRELLQLESKYVIKIHQDDQLIGCCLLKKIGWTNQWSEIAVLIVDTKFENQGLASQLFDQAVEILESNGESIYTVSRNPKVIHLATRCGFQVMSVFKYPTQIAVDNLLYICSFGRIKESIRKFFVFGNQPQFQYLIRESTKSK